MRILWDLVILRCGKDVKEFVRCSKTKISSEGFQKVEITQGMKEEFGLSQKAVGEWAVVAKTETEYRLRKLRCDGYFASDKYNNHQGISLKIWRKMFGVESAKKADVSELISGLSTRKRRWIEDVIVAMGEVENLSQVVKKIGRAKIILKILEDTNPKRVGGKLYSSIEGAIKFWSRNYADVKMQNYFLG